MSALFRLILIKSRMYIIEIDLYVVIRQLLDDFRTKKLRSPRSYAYTRPVEGWIFIPDISGFSQFVHETAISHSGHIIQELLEILTESKFLDMELIEIEGDALFFLGRGPNPSLEQIENQAEKMFLKFHEHLLLYENQRVCPCGACRTAHTLSLKFVSHSGPFQFIDVAGHHKPHGAAVITAHRLLKNDAPSDEYLLLSESIAQPSTSGYKKLTSRYDIGDINYYVKELTFLKNQYKMPEIRNVHHLRAPSLKFSRIFKTDLQTLSDLLIDFSRRESWNRDIDSFQFDEHEINQVGSKHVCIIDGQKLNIETITREHGEGEVVLGERTTDVPIIDKLTTFWIITPQGENQHKLEVELFIEQKAFWKKLLNPFIKKKFKKGITKGLDNISALLTEKQKN